MFFCFKIRILCVFIFNDFIALNFKKFTFVFVVINFIRLMTHYFIAKLVTYIGQTVSFSAIDMVHKNLGFLG